MIRPFGFSQIEYLISYFKINRWQIYKNSVLAKQNKQTTTALDQGIGLCKIWQDGTNTANI